jgi:hypothetical protein
LEEEEKTRHLVWNGDGCRLGLKMKGKLSVRSEEKGNGEPNTKKEAAF